ncbi:sigma factor-like helix-turn-helix DNA-binding protein [Lysinibacillus agricola]
MAKLRFIDGMTYQEIADKLGYSYGYIRKVVSQGNKEVTTTLVKA